jgi:hypothetical protein
VSNIGGNVEDTHSIASSKLETFAIWTTVQHGSCPHCDHGLAGVDSESDELVTLLELGEP